MPTPFTDRKANFVGTPGFKSLRPYQGPVRSSIPTHCAHGIMPANPRLSSCRAAPALRRRPGSLPDEC